MPAKDETGTYRTERESGAPAPRPSRLWIVVLAASGALAVPSLWRPGSISSGLAQFTAGLLPPAAIALALRRGRLGRTGPWWMALAATGVYAAANAPFYLWTPLSGRPLPFPSVADGLYVIAYSGLIAFLTLVVRARRADRGGTIDALVVAFGVGALWWTLFFEPIVDLTGVPWSTRAVSLAYPLSDLLILGTAARLLLSRSIRRPAEYTLLAWTAALLLADGFYTYTYSHGHPVGWVSTLAWVVAFGLLAAAALHPEAEAITAPDRPGAVAARPRVVVLGGAALFPPLSAGWELLSPDHDGHVGRVVAMLVLMVVLYTLVLVRLVGLHGDLAEERRLQAQLIEAHDQLGRHAAELDFRATHDPLTGLANRVVLVDRLTTLLAGPGRYGTAVVLLDLDAFKSVNDTMGHLLGDELLRVLASRLPDAVRPGDTVMRLGGDEFAVVVEGVASEEALAAVSRRLLSVFRDPVMLAGIPYRPRASLGAALATPGDDAGSLLQAADIAMYRAKGRGGATYEVFQPEFRLAVVERHRLETELRDVTTSGQLVLHYQPIVALATGQLVSAEALVRWVHPERGLVPPGLFIEAAERTGAIIEIGRWVLEEACRQAATWNAVYRPDNPLSISVNVSPHQLRDPDFGNRVSEALATWGLHGHLLTLEVTETALVTEPDAASGHLDHLRALGVELAMDDFGTGYSSLGLLRTLPVGTIKIDRSFVAGLASDAEQFAVASAIVGLLRSLGRQMCAEGIEEPAQVAHLRTLNCPLGQGYLFSRPVPAGEFEAFLRVPARFSLAGGLRPL